MQSEKLALPLALSSIAIVFSTVAGVQVGVIAGCEAFKPLAVLSALDGFVTGILTVVGAATHGVTGAIAGYAGGTVIAYLFRHRQMWIECRRANIPRVPLRLSQARSELPALFSFVLPTVLLVSGTQPSEWLVRMLLVRVPDGMAELGLFTAAFSWAQVVQFIPMQIAGPAMPILTNVHATGDRQAFRRLLLEAMGVILLVAAAIAVPLAILSKFVMGFHGPAFREGSMVLTIIVLAYVIGAVSTLLRLAFLSLGRAWLQLSLTFAWGVTLPLSFLLLRHKGAVGLAQSYAVAFLLITIVQVFAAWWVFQKNDTRAPAPEAEGLC